MVRDISTRRGFLRSSLAVGAGVGITSRGTVSRLASGSPRASDSQSCTASESTQPHVSTADHFSIDRTGSVSLRPGVGSTDYETAGEEFPWGGEELVVYVHGWDLNYACGILEAQQMAEVFEDIWWYNPNVVGLTWDSSLHWVRATALARQNGPKLAAFLYQYAHWYPHTAIRLIGHSLGALIIAEALSELRAWNSERIVDSVVFLAGAILARDVAKAGDYGPTFESQTGGVYNFWNAEDSLLGRLFRTYQSRPAVGSNGVDGDPPLTYSDYEVTEWIDGHESNHWLTADFVGDWVVPELEELNTFGLSV